MQIVEICKGMVAHMSGHFQLVQHIQYREMNPISGRYGRGGEHLHQYQRFTQTSTLTMFNLHITGCNP